MRLGKVKRFGTSFSEGYDLSLQDEYGETPLHYAAENGNFDNVKVLVRAGADINLRDNNQRTPIDCAREQRRNCYDEVIDFLTAWADPRNPIHSQRVELISSRRRVVWGDSICINQGNIKERNSQVQLMSRIYKSANSAIAWLGRRELQDNAIFGPFIFLLRSSRPILINTGGCSLMKYLT